MDISGNNRYELLSMEEDSAASHERAESTVSKKKINTSAPIKKANSNVVKKDDNKEKENKSKAPKNDVIAKKSNAVNRKGNNLQSGLANGNRANDGELRRVAFKSQNTEVREQKNNRNFREGGEFGVEKREPRQFRDRDNRGPPRDGLTRGKREFDRQSGSDKTGVKAVDKREGAGAHNWGSVKQEIDDINKSTADADGTLMDKEESSNEQTPEQPVVAEEEEVKEFTLDEWKAMRGERTKPQYNIRKANEGEDTSLWKKMVVLNKKKEGDGDSEEEYEYDPSMYPQRIGRLQRIVDIQFNFNDGRRGGGGFGRGRGRNSRPGGDHKGPRSDGEKQPRQQRAFGDRQQQKRSTPNFLKVDDERQFPTLS